MEANGADEGIYPRITLISAKNLGTLKRPFCDGGLEVDLFPAVVACDNSRSFARLADLSANNANLHEEPRNIEEDIL